MREPALHAPALSHPGESGLSRGTRQARHRTQGSPHSPVSSGADPGSETGKKSGSGSGMNNPDHISQSLKTNFWVKILKFFDADPGLL